MAHKSHRKHLKNLHKHEPATPKAKSPIVKAEIEMARRAKPTAKGRAAAAEPATSASAKPTKKRGIVRRIARAATKRPRNLVARAKARVKAFLGAD